MKTKIMQVRTLERLYELAKGELKDFVVENLDDLGQRVQQNEFDSELEKFFRKYTAQLRTEATGWAHSAIEKAREQGIEDAESATRYRNRNRNYKESTDGDD